MAVLFGGMFQGVTIIWDREFGFLKEVLVAPISRVTIVLGKTFSGTAVTIVQGCLTLIFAPLVDISDQVNGGVPNSPVEASSTNCHTSGVVAATRMQTFEGFGVISNFVIMPLYFLSGGVFPVEHLPGWMALLVRINPVTYGVDLMRHALAQHTAFAIELDISVLGLFAVAMVGLALLWFRRES